MRDSLRWPRDVFKRRRFDTTSGCLPWDRTATRSADVATCRGSVLVGFSDDGRWLAVSLGFGLISLLYLVMQPPDAPRPRIFWLWTISFVSGFALLVPEDARES